MFGFTTAELARTVNVAGDPLLTTPPVCTRESQEFEGDTDALTLRAVALLVVITMLVELDKPLPAEIETGFGFAESTLVVPPVPSCTMIVCVFAALVVS